MSLRMRMMIVWALMFSFLYAAAVVFGSLMGVESFTFYIIAAAFMIWLQYQLGPRVVEWTARVRYIEESDMPHLYAMVREQAQRAGIPMPRVAISETDVPNAFAFGRGPKDGRVCFTRGILRLLEPDELKAVTGHEITHLKNNDVLTITVLSVVPLLLYRLALHCIFSASYGRRQRDQSGVVLLGLTAFLGYFLTNLIVLYASRVREYYADRGSVALGNPPRALASALYKLVYGNAVASSQKLRELEGMKAFFLNDPSRARREIRELSQLDFDRSGTIDPHELQALLNTPIRLKFTDRLMELLSTHPNMLKRIQYLAQLQQEGVLQQA